MKCGVEDGYLWKAGAEHIPSRLNAFNICRIVEWRKLDTILDGTENCLIDLDRVFEVFATMNNAMTYCVDVGNSLDLFRTFVGTRPALNQFNRGASIS